MEVIEKPTRKIYILLTKFPDFGSKMVRCFTGYRYSHTSIGLDEDMNTFYSFVCKGFIVEKITRYVKPDKEPFPCQMYELEVSEEVYLKIKELLQMFVENKEILQYTKLGTFLCIMRIPYRKRYCYFCSYFVAFILEQANALKLKKKSYLYLPGDFRKHSNIKFKYVGNLRTMVDDFKLKNCSV